ncbi:MAG: DUF547 domain-containing protein [Pseudomonadota bacterium]
MGLFRYAAMLVLMALMISGIALSPIMSADAGQKAKLIDEHWLAHEPASKVTIEHADWQAMLDIYLEVADPFDPTLEVIRSNERRNNRHFATYEVHDQFEVVGKHHGRREHLSRFDYGAVRPSDRQRLNDYLTRMQAVTVTDLNRDEQRAYWLNLYNALIMKIVIDNYPIASILDVDISDDPVRRGPWTARLVTVEGRALSLDNIAHGILRPIWQDPRLIYGLSCAALGCPEPIPMAFRGDNVDTLLDEAASRFINHTRGAAIREIGKRRDSLEGDRRLHVSSLYDWYAEDFGRKSGDQAVIRHLRQYAIKPLEPMLTGASEIDSTTFNWKLNDIED